MSYLMLSQELVTQAPVSMPTQSPSVVDDRLDEVSVLMQDTTGVPLVVITGAVLTKIRKFRLSILLVLGDQDQVTVLTPHTVLSHG